MPAEAAAVDRAVTPKLGLYGSTAYGIDSIICCRQLHSNEGCCHAELHVICCGSVLLLMLLPVGTHALTTTARREAGAARTADPARTTELL
jgi:hypothetical protein